MVGWWFLACRPSIEAEVRVADAARSEVYGAGVLFTANPSVQEDDVVMWVAGDGADTWTRSLIGKPLRVQPSGASMLVLVADIGRLGGRVQRETLDGEVLSTTPAPANHHDVLELPDGRVAWLAHEDRPMPFGDDADAVVQGDAIMVGKEGAEAERLWSFFDDYDVEPWPVCTHTREGMRDPGVSQWTHANSLVHDPSRPGAIGVMSRNLDAVVWVDLATGATLEQWGGRDSDVAVAAGAAVDHAHLSQAPGADRLLVFDNRLHAGGAPRVVELGLDRDAGALEVVWSYQHPDVGRVGFLGDAQRLPGGNTLIAWGDEARLTEVDPDGSIVWELQLDGVRYVGRASMWDAPGR